MGIEKREWKYNTNFFGCNEYFDRYSFFRPSRSTHTHIPDAVDDYKATTQTHGYANHSGEERADRVWYSERLSGDCVWKLLLLPVSFHSHWLRYSVYLQTSGFDNCSTVVGKWYDMWINRTDCTVLPYPSYSHKPSLHVLFRNCAEQTFTDPVSDYRLLKLLTYFLNKLINCKQICRQISMFLTSCEPFVNFI